jgi:hypothetical protein
MRATAGAIFAVGGFVLCAAPPVQAALVCSMASGEDDGSFRILGDVRKQQLLIAMKPPAAVGGVALADVFLDCNGDGLTTGAEDLRRTNVNADAFDIRLGGSDTIAITYRAGTYDGGANALGSSRRFTVTSGPGTNVLTLATDGVVSLSNARLTLDVLGGAAADKVDVQLGEAVTGGAGPAAVIVRADLGAGNDTMTLVLPEMSATSFESRVQLGLGSNTFTAEQSPATSIAGSSVTLDVEGGSGVDSVTARFKGMLANSARAIVNADLGAGNDVFTGAVDLATTIVASGNSLRFKAKGGLGNDKLTLTRNGTLGAAQRLAGLLEAELLGGAGVDTIDVDLAAGGFDMRGTLRLALDGGAGNDALALLFDASQGASARIFDISFMGGIGNDALKLAFNDASATTTADNFGPAGTILFDGGAGSDTCTATSSAPIPVPAVRSGARALFRNCER